MNSKEKIKNIKSVINEFYHTEKCEGRLTECANDCWKSYQKDCDEIKQDLDRLEKLEKELKQTKLNFKNSQTHSKNCYKKLKEKFERGKEVYHRNYELIQENGKLKQAVKTWNENGGKLLRENTKLKQALDIFERKYIHIHCLRRTKNVEEYNKVIDKFDKYDFFDYLIEEDYELLKEVLINEK